MFVLNIAGQIIFLDKVLFISKTKHNNKRKAADSDGKPLGSLSYCITFHYDTGQTSEICYALEKDRDENFYSILEKIGLDGKNTDIMIFGKKNYNYNIG